MNRIVFVASLSALLVASSANAQSVDEETKKGLERLNTFVGDWDVRLTGNDAAKTRSHMGGYLVVVSSGQVRDPYLERKGSSSEPLIPTRMNIASGRSTEDGDFYQAGKWKDDSRELVVTGKRGNEKTITLAKIIDNDTIEWAVAVYVDGERKSYFEGTNTRIKDKQ